MNIDRPMVSLFFEIKRNLPDLARDNIKISTPDLGERLVQIYALSDDAATKKLIELFLIRAGEEWVKLLEPHKQKQALHYQNEQLRRDVIHRVMRRNEVH